MEAHYLQSSEDPKSEPDGHGSSSVAGSGGTDDLRVYRLKTEWV